MALSDIFELVGLHVAIVNRSFTIPLKNKSEKLEQNSTTSTLNNNVVNPSFNDKLIPDFASIYQKVYTINSRKGLISCLFDWNQDKRNRTF